MRRFAGSCRFVFNRALALQKELFELRGVPASYADLCAVLVDWKQDKDKDKETDWLNEAPSQALQQSLKNLDAAWARRLDSLKKLKQGRIKRAQLIGEPVFKKKEKHASFRYPQGTCLEQNNNRIWLPKLGWVRYRNRREVLGAVKNVTVSLAGGRWMVSIQTEREVEAPVHRSATAVGIDMGVVRLATLSDGTIYGPRNSFRQHQAGLCKAQQSMSRKNMSRKKKFSQNWKRAKAGLACLPIRVANARRDYLHKASTAISKNHAMVCVEDLRVSNLSSSAAGSRQSPGSKVRAESGLNRSILDQGWAELRRQLEYKLARTCPECGYEANADLGQQSM
jgi:putative transposase